MTDEEIADEVRAEKGYANWVYKQCIRAEASGGIP